MILLPLLFLLGRAIADVALIVVALAFLTRSAAARDVAWIREPWVVVALVWVAWLTLGGLFSEHPASATGKAFVQVRFVLFAAALATVHFRDPYVRANFVVALAAAVVLVAVDCLVQASTGYSLTGRGLPELYRLSGPFASQKAGTFLAKTIFPALLPMLLLVPHRKDMAWICLVILIVVGAVITLTGERSALLTFGLGTICCLFLLPRPGRLLLPVVLLVLLVGGALSLTRPILIERFVGHTADDLSNFTDKRYGLIFRSGLALAEQQPVTGIGVAEFPIRCTSPDLADIGPEAVRCVSHPHNPWMEMLVEGGMVGLAFWLILVSLWFRQIARGGKAILLVGTASLLPFVWPFMTSMSLFTTWNAVLWWQAVGLLLALSPPPGGTPRSPGLPP